MSKLLKQAALAALAAAALTPAGYAVYAACAACPAFGRFMERASGVAAAFLAALAFIVLGIEIFAPRADSDTECETSGSGAADGGSGHAGARTGTP